MVLAIVQYNNTDTIQMPYRYNTTIQYNGYGHNMDAIWIQYNNTIY